jgi:hypothetical protein
VALGRQAKRLQCHDLPDRDGVVELDHVGVGRFDSGDGVSVMDSVTDDVPAAPHVI